MACPVSIVVANGQHVTLGMRVVIVDFDVYTITTWKQQAQWILFLLPSAEIGMKLAAFGLASLEGDADISPCSIVTIVLILMSTISYQKIRLESGIKLIID